MAKRRSRKQRGARAPDVAPQGLNAVSNVEGVVWPGVGPPAGASVLAIYYQLQQSQWWSADALANHQWRQLRVLLDAAANTRYYAPLLGAAGYAPGMPAARAVWERLPVLPRQVLQARKSELINPAAPGAHGPRLSSSTSGSTGMPVEVERQQLLDFFHQAVALRERLWHDRDLARRTALLRVFKDMPAARRPPGARSAGWAPLAGVVEATGETFALDLHASLDDQLRWLESVNPHYLATYPSNLKGLLGHAALAGRRPKLPALEQVCTMSEVVDEELRSLVEGVLGVPLVDAYSAQETGTIALQCPGHPVYHCMSEVVHVEVLDEAGRACAPGETGRVVVTPLHNLHMPLLRYDIGDYAEVGEPCPCGRGLPVLNRILGRSRNLLTYPDGRRRWPLPGDGRYREIAPISQYQFVQRTAVALDVNLVVERPLSEAEETALRTWVQQRLDYPFELTLNYFDNIPRSASGKFEDFVSELDP